MAHVICRYRVETTSDENGADGFDERFLEGTYKKVEWDGLSLLEGNRRIYSHEWFVNEVETTGSGYWGGANDILYLKIDDDIYIGNSR